MVNDLSDGFVLRFLGEYLASGVAPASVNSKRCQILALWRFAKKHHLCERGPEDVPRMKDRPKLPEAWTIEETGRILDVARSLLGPVAQGIDIDAAKWWTSLFLVCYDSGQRIGAIMSLSPHDIDLERGWIIFSSEIQKEGKPKLCRLYPETIEACPRDLVSRP